MTKLHFRGWPSKLTRRQAKKNRLLAARPKNTARFFERLEQRALLSAVTVNTISDTDAVAPASSPNDSSGNISLRSAIEYLDANGGGAIDFAAALYASGPATITLGGTELAITQAMTITGPGASLMTIDANSKSRIFDVDDGYGAPDIKVAINGLTLTEGNASTGFGGAVYNAKTLMLNGDTIADSFATYEGGGILNFGTLALANDRISGNQAGEGGGGISNYGYHCTVTSSNDTISGNRATSGGGILNESTLTSTNDIIGGNTATRGGGIFNNGTLTSTNDTISGNRVIVDGGGIYNTGTLTSTNDTISGNAGGIVRGFIGGGIDNIGTVNAVNSIVAGNTASGAPDLFGSLSASSAGNIIGLPAGETLSQVLATDIDGKPLLADNGGPTQTIALASDSPAIGNAIALATLNAAVTDTTNINFSVSDATYLAVGDALKVDHEIVLITAINATNNTITVTRGADGTTAAAHVSGAGLYLALDQRGYVRVTNDIGAVEGPQPSIVVNTTADTHADGFTTLREAITQADAEPWPGGTTITFASGLTGTITLTQGQLAVTQSMTITGPGASLLTIDANGKSRIFDVDGGNNAAQINVAIADLTMSDGNSSGGNGGAVSNAETLSLARDAIVGSLAAVGGGVGSDLGGGGIYNTGTLFLTNDAISGDTASGDGGGILNTGTLASTNDAISGNTAAGGGGGIYNDGTLTSTNDSIGANLAGDGGGGGIYNQSDGVLTSTNDSISRNLTVFGAGVGILNNGTLTSTNDTISANSTGFGANGGGIANSGTLYSTDDTINGNSTKSVGGGIFNTGTLASTNDTISGNTAGGGAAGIYNDGTLTSTDDTISGNSTDLGSIGIFSSGTFNAVNSIVADNTAPGARDLFGSLSANSAGNIIGLPAGETLSQVLATDDNGHPLLANNGGPTQTIALAAGSPAIGKAAPLATLSGAVTDTTNTSFSVNDATFLAVGDALKVDSEIVLVTAVDSTNNTITVTRAADGTTATTHANGADVFLAFDQRGLPRNANPDIGAFETQVPTVNITVQNASQVYNGAADPASASVVGLNSATIATSPAADIAFVYYAGTLTAGQIAGDTPLTRVPVNVGSYTVVANFNSDLAGYRDASSAPADFTITKAAVTYQIQNDAQSYGTPADLAKDLGTTIATGVNGETLNITYSSSGDTATANVGTYDIDGTPANGTGQVSNYKVTLTDGTLTVKPFALTFQIGDDMHVRGTAVNLAADLPATISTGVNGETLAISYSSTGDTASAPLGQYPINGAVSNGSGLASNYAVTLKPGTLTVGYPAGVGYLAGVPGDGTPQTFVRNLYRELLGREPSAGDLAYWTAQVQADSSVVGREQVISFFMNSPEYKAHYVDTLYEVFLGRAPDAAGLAFWSAKMGDPGTPGEHGGSADERFILAAIVGSDEFYAQAGGTDQGFVQALYHDLLGRAGDAADVNAWSALVHNQDRDSVVRDFLGALETEHKLLDNFFPAQGGTAANPLPVPGAPAPSTSDDLAIVTGLGWENLYLQGPDGNSPDGNDVFFNSLAGGAPWDDVRLLLLASDQFYNNSNRPVTE